MLGTIAAGGRPSNDQIADIAIFAFDSAVDNMAEDATTHHPATERADLLSTYEFRDYRDAAPARRHRCRGRRRANRRSSRI